LIAEIAAVMGESLDAAESRIQRVLNPEHVVVAKPAQKSSRFRRRLHAER
jgi:hypothetical protein